jgi:hypothetical protein
MLGRRRRTDGLKLTATPEEARLEAAALASRAHAEAAVRLEDAAAMKPCATTERTVLLHADFLDKNLVRRAEQSNLHVAVSHVR